MRIVSFCKDDHRGFGIYDDTGIIEEVINFKSITDFIRQRQLAALLPLALQAYDLSEVEFLPPVPAPSKILAVGLNYRNHLQETGRPEPKFPMIFARFANAQVGSGSPMVCPWVSHQFDYEGELAVIIGRTGRYVRQVDADSYVFGYSCYNDGSVRDWQNHTSQFTPGKNFPRTGAFGPWVVTKDEFGELEGKELVTRLNGKTVQRAYLTDMIFDIPTLIEYCSNFTQLEPGDIILTGTPGGVGSRRNPPLWLKPGDVVEVEISGIGILSNRVVVEDQPS